ncbi:MAG TPA: DUF5522 domain-containing protein [Terracidiphilus sp.]|nr:DUF5522 domain-containing protein [Terracidiphilus sp.]
MDSCRPHDARPSARSLEPEDFYMEGANIVFTAAYHLKRGYCCNSGCRHCPYQPPDGCTPDPPPNPGGQ